VVLFKQEVCIDNMTKLSIAQKFREIRKTKGLTQEDLANALGCSAAKISIVVSDKGQYTDDDIKTLRKFLDVEKAPLTDGELTNFKQRLYSWRDLTRNGLLTEARVWQKELTIITELPFEPDLNITYRMFEVRLNMRERNIDFAEEMLKADEALIDDMTDENKYHFYFNMGSIHTYKDDFKTALDYYLKAKSLENSVYEKDPSLYFNLAICYSELGKYVLVITTLEQARNSFDYNKTSVAWIYIDNMLAMNYSRMGYILTAKRLLEECLEDARKAGNSLRIGYALHNYGCTCWKAKEFDKAIEYFDKASEYFTKGSNKDYLENLYWKIRSLIDMKKTSASRALLQEARTIAGESDHYSLLFESLSHLLTINKDESLDFVENKTIPYMIDKHEYFRVLDYCGILEEVFEKRGKGCVGRLAKIIKINRDIIGEMSLG